MRPSSHDNPSLRLARLFGIGRGDFLGWEDRELRNILLQQLAAPLSKWLKPDSHAFPPAADASTFEISRLVALGDLLNHPKPPLPFLREAKNVAKVSDARPRAPLPPAVASALYLSTIAVAMTRCGQRITKMNDEQLREGFGWMVEQSWIDPPLRQMALDALALLSQ